MLGLSVHKLALVTMGLFKCVSSPLELQLLSLNFLWPVSILNLSQQGLLGYPINAHQIHWAEVLLCEKHAKAWKRWSLGSFPTLRSSHGASLLYVYGYHMYSRIPDSISNFSKLTFTQPACYIASLIGWVYISLSFFSLKKPHVFSLWESGEMFHNAQLGDSGQLEEVSSLCLPPCKSQGSNSRHWDWQQGLSTN